MILYKQKYDLWIYIYYNQILFFYFNMTNKINEN